jgi:hypothetical protein
MKHRFFSDRIIIAVVLSTTFVFQNCKKDSDVTGGTNNNPSGYYLTATINGQSWTANVSSSLKNSPAVAASTYVNGTNVVMLLGINVVNKDSSAIAIVFPKNITLSQSFAFDASKYSEGVYVSEISSGSGTYYGYNTLPATGGTGSFNITKFDETEMTIEGTFTGTFGSVNGKPSVQITNGKFRCVYTTNVNQLPKSGGLKM